MPPRSVQPLAAGKCNESSRRTMTNVEVCAQVVKRYSDLKTKSTPNSPWHMSRDLVCFSHLRWGFVYQRPQHLMTQFARYCSVHYVEEPIVDDHIEPFLEE